MTTFYDITDIEKQNGHMVGELKDAKRILKGYLAQHIAQKGRDCYCDECQQARAWLARNK